MAGGYTEIRDSARIFWRLWSAELRAASGSIECQNAEYYGVNAELIKLRGRNVMNVDQFQRALENGACDD